jgi:plastocyanin
MSRFFRRSRSVLLAAALAGCQHVAHHDHGAAAAAVAQADWGRAEQVVIEMLSYKFQPAELRLRVNQPYRLTLRNTSIHDHYFTAPEFFRSVATRKAMVPGKAEVKVPYFRAFEVLKGVGEVEIFLVPLARGRYRAVCDMQDHLEHKIEGTILVE